MRRRNGLTPIRLILVIVGVVGGVVLLAAILWPVFAPARDSHAPDPDYMCERNLKQLGLGIRMYTSDYDERFPQDSFRWNGREVGWEEAVFLYIKDPYMYYCPVQPNLPQGESWRTTSPGSVPTSLGYGANHDYVFPPPPRPTVFEKQIKNPAATILLADQGDLRRGLFAPIAGGGRWAVPIGNVALRHKDGANFVFVDGHVKWMKAGDAWGKDDSLWDLK